MKFEQSIFVNPMLALYTVDCILVGLEGREFVRWYNHTPDASPKDYWALSAERDTRVAIQPDALQQNNEWLYKFWFALPATDKGNNHYSIALDPRLRDAIECSYLILDGKLAHSFLPLSGLDPDVVTTIHAPLITLDYSQEAHDANRAGLRIYDWANFSLSNFRSS